MVRIDALKRLIGGMEALCIMGNCGFKSVKENDARSVRMQQMNAVYGVL